ncbi:MAG: hypothetical protein V1658_01440 [Candidatus Micrarchaeota archaeon]
MDLEFAAKYPFSERARNFLAKENILSVSEEELDAAGERLMAGLRGEEIRQRDPKRALVTYVLARIFVGALNNYTANSKFSKAEAKRVSEMLAKETDDDFAQIAREFYPSLSMKREDIEISVLEYVKFGSDLPNQKVEGGKVLFTRQEFARILEKAIAVKIADISFNPKTLPVNIKHRVEELRPEAEKLLMAAGGSALSFKGKYLNLPAMKRILLGLPEGKRYYGSMTLSIACVKDNLSKEAAEAVLVEYARNCGKSTHGFTEREALATLEWVYRHPTINFSMKTLKEQGLVDETTMRATEIELGRLGGTGKIRK